MRYLYIIVVFVFFIFYITACQKEEVVSESKIEEPIIEEIDSVELTAIYHEQILESQFRILDVLLIVLRETAFQPSLYNLAGDNVVDVRTGCPCSSVVGSGAMGNDFPKTMTSTFDDGGGDCMAGGVSYSGALTVLVKDSIGAAFNGDEIEITETDFVANGYDFDMPGKLTFNKQNTSNPLSLKYNYKLKDAPLVLTKTIGGITYTTTIPMGASGNITAINDGDDVPQNPITYVNNQFELFISDFVVTCSNGSSPSQMFCVDVSSGSNKLVFQPSVCACPIDGNFRIGGTTCNNTSSNSTTYDFGADANGNEMDECDEFVLNKTTSMVETLTFCK